MPTITRKIELVPDVEGLTDKQSKDTCYGMLREIDYNLYKVANLLVSHLFGMEEFLNMMRLQNDEYVELRKRLGLKKTSEEEGKQILARLKDIDAEIIAHKNEMAPTNLRTFAYRAAKQSEYADHLPGDVLNSLKDEVFKHYSAVSKDRLRGERALSTYKRGMPIPFMLRGSQQLVQTDGEFYLQWYGGTRFHLNFGRDRSNNRLIVERCMGCAKDGITYKMAQTASVQIKERKIFLLLSVEIPKEENNPIKGKVMGVDLGVVWPAYAAINDGPERRHIGDGLAFQRQRDVFRRRFRDLQRCQLTQSGHGRKHRMKALEQLREKERNWVQTENHRISREVVELAKRWQVEAIQMEHLKGFGRNEDGEVQEKHKRLLGRWSYFELQKDIEYKAERAGIKVRYVNPAYTSLQCSECGEMGTRPERDTFVCTNPACKWCNKPMDADMNGARNIAASKDIIKKNE